MTHSHSSADVELQIQTKRECSDIKNVLMVISSKHEWLLTKALAQQIQHTGRRNDIRVTVILSENASASRPLFR